MLFDGLWGDISDFSIVDALLVSLIAMVLVFFVLIIIIFVSGGFQKVINGIDAKTHILPKEENKILDEDEDAVAAVLAATIDFYKETGKNPEVMSVTRIED